VQERVQESSKERSREREIKNEIKNEIKREREREIKRENLNKRAKVFGALESFDRLEALGEKGNKGLHQRDKVWNCFEDQRDPRNLLSFWWLCLYRFQRLQHLY